MKYNYKKILNIIYYILVIIICSIMLFFIKEKEGFHEDEMFSYGSSNCIENHVFQPYGKTEFAGVVFDNEIFKTKNPIKNAMYYLNHPSEFQEKLDEEEKREHPIWKTKEEAIEYVTIQKKDILNFFSVYFNQATDVHPPLFYFIVHIVSSLYLDKFSKYIIFSVNIFIFIGCCIMIKKILENIKKEKIAIPSLILYGFSMGAISTVMFQRMYMLLTFFILAYTYIVVKIINNNFKIDKSLMKMLMRIILLGFLTQYYFVVYCIGLFIILEIIMYKNGKKKEMINLFKIHIKSAFIGILIYSPSIYHIFFSYRGITTIKDDYYMMDFLKVVFEAYNINLFLGIILLLICVFICIKYLIKKKDYIPFSLLFAIIIYLIIISKISPYLDLRYIMGILPLVSIIFFIIFDKIIKNVNDNVIVVLMILVSIFSLYSLKENTPQYLYKGYSNNIKIAKENSNLKFIYIEDNGFNHIQSMPEFMIYDKSLILNINKDELKELKNNIELENEEEFIVSIKNYLDVNNILKKIKTLTKKEKYELLLDGENETGNIIYKFY